MTRIHIQAKGLDQSMSALLQDGCALLIGRSPDPTRIDWHRLRAVSKDGDIPNLPARLSDYHVSTLQIPSQRASGNHLFLLKEGATTAIFDLGSRNGTWVKLEPHRPLCVSGAMEVTLSLSGLLSHEPRMIRPAAAEWTAVEEFGPAVVRALNRWLVQHDAPAECILCAQSSDTQSLPLADGQSVSLRITGTLPFSMMEFQDTASQYVHDQNTRFLQLERRVAGMVASSPAIRNILSRLAESAACSRRVILLGPTGVGKELLARSYHGYSPRHAGPFVTVNCALLEKELLHAQLFGARRGSFTGAVADVPGLIEAAHGGTLFLDELGEMSLDVQKALLRFLDARGEYYRLGDTRPRHADVQIVCASNIALDDPAYRADRFRHDLWYRLAATVLRIPPLCERRDDILAFLRSQTLPGTSLCIAECLTKDALALVLADSWPGNFRDLENFCERLPLTTRPNGIDLQACQRALLEGRVHSVQPTNAVEPSAILPELPPSTAGTAKRVTTKQPNESGVDYMPHYEADGDSNAALGWECIAEHAVRAFLEDHGSARAGWDQLQILVERYLKPIFVAQAATTRKQTRAGRATNYSALARRLHIGDGSTVKTHLARFEERFATIYSANASQSISSR